MKFKRLFKFFLIFCLLLSAYGLARLYYYLTDDFRIANITYSEMPYRHHQDSPLSIEEEAKIKKILLQPYYYLDKGAQSYAFISEDQEYILKFFKFKHLKPHWMIQLLPSIPPFNHLKEHKRLNKQRKLQDIFQGYEIAYQYNREGSQLIYLHLNPTEFLQQQLTLVDKIGRTHQIDADQIVFLIQKKGEPLKDRLNRFFKQNQIEEVKKALKLILNMYMKEYRLGIYDRDHGVLQNTGFIDKEPFHLDVGKLSKNEKMIRPEFHKQDLEVVIWKIDNWIKDKYPEYYSDISTFLAEEYGYLTGTSLDISTITLQEVKARRHQL